MSYEPDRLERLISRQLDGECSADEREELDLLIATDAQARRALTDYEALDQQVGDALRVALDRPRRHRILSATWTRVGKGLMVAAAACVAALAWLQPTQPSEPGPGSARRQQAGATHSWFVPAGPQVDAVEPVPSRYVRPEVQVRGTQREWIIIPGDRPGVYQIIEVDRVRTHAIRLQRDF